MSEFTGRPEAPNYELMERLGLIAAGAERVIDFCRQQPDSPAVNFRETDTFVSASIGKPGIENGLSRLMRKLIDVQPGTEAAMIDVTKQKFNKNDFIYSVIINGDVQDVSAKHTFLLTTDKPIGYYMGPWFEHKTEVDAPTADSFEYVFNNFRKQFGIDQSR